MNYVVADLFDSPPAWRHSFDFVFETNTLQALPASLRPHAAEKIAEFVKPGGVLLVIARGHESEEPEGQLPWPLTREEFDGLFARACARNRSRISPIPSRRGCAVFACFTGGRKWRRERACPANFGTIGTSN